MGLIYIYSHSVEGKIPSYSQINTVVCASKKIAYAYLHIVNNAVIIMLHYA